jgi:hypothetical protein
MPAPPTPNNITRSVTRHRRQQHHHSLNTATHGHICLSTTAPATSNTGPAAAPPATTTASPSTFPAHAFWTANTVVDPAAGAALEYCHLKLGPDGEKWIHGAANEMGRLAEGVQPHMPTGSETIHSIHHSEILEGRRATYLKIVASYQPHKAEIQRVHFTCGGDRIDYKDKVKTDGAGLEVVKLLLNSTISTLGARWMSYDIKDFYLDTPMQRYEYMRIPVKHIPTIIMEQYNLHPLVLVEIR